METVAINAWKHKTVVLIIISRNSPFSSFPVFSGVAGMCVYVYKNQGLTLEEGVVDLVDC